MKVIHRRCAGLDVHKETVVACARCARGKRVVSDTRTFSTTMKGLTELAEWLGEHSCSHVAMEATGVYWKPVWYVLEARFELILANAAHVKNVPGRKTDVKDAEWLADLLAHGLIRSSFVPPSPIQEIRDLTRTRKQLVRGVVQHTQRIQKTLESANIKLASVISDVLGVTGRSVLEAIAEGNDDPERLLELKHPRIECSDEAFVEALHGTTTAHHRFLIRLHLQQVDAIEKAIEDVDRQLGDVIQPFRTKVELLTTIPGVSQIVAQVIVGEVGVDMTRFPSSANLISWAGLCPRNDQSAGKRRSTRILKSGTWLKTQLVQAAWSAVRAKDSHLRAKYHRLKARRGPKKAIVAVAASILTAAYHILLDELPYHDLGPNHFRKHSKARATRRLVQRLRQLGYVVTLEDAA